MITGQTMIMEPRRSQVRCAEPLHWQEQRRRAVAVVGGSGGRCSRKAAAIGANPAPASPRR